MKVKAGIISVMCIPLLLAGCVSQSELDQVMNEKKVLEEKLVSQGNDLKTAQEKVEAQEGELQQLKGVTDENNSLKEKLLLYRSEANPKVSNESNYNTTAEEEYINNLIEIIDFKAVYMDSLLDGMVPGVVFKLKNKGEKTLSRVEVTVYFTDDRGKNIAEESYSPVNEIGIVSYKELKPNYTFQMEKDRFYKADLVPKEWKSGNANIKITKIEFKNE
ncbi:hypothetical protein [Paenibacillus polysaccharolyticus]|uniref:hypothetical protein n=1 Tax=Paenibacillus polysaccharolyticus TaxID=582692 RepID=UPI00204233BD|nr:hypothetical protein [Paenibacillus polysaccharolyticus]